MNAAKTAMNNLFINIAKVALLGCVYWAISFLLALIEPYSTITMLIIVVFVPFSLGLALYVLFPSLKFIEIILFSVLMVSTKEIMNIIRIYVVFFHEPNMLDHIIFSLKLLAYPAPVSLLMTVLGFSSIRVFKKSSSVGRVEE
jgi:hypothetical protein